MSKDPQVIIRARWHGSRKVIFVELIAEVLAWAERVNLEPQQITHLMNGFRQSKPSIERSKND